uniref:Uncharacterized protein n=1 Tax=Propithecus coquereli TaxID=379532 RepID=A0A2K6F7Z6_PROCO
MVELGEWDKALSVAPGVSVKYWKKLMQSFLCDFSGNAACEGNMQTIHVSTPKGASYSGDIYKEDFNELLHKVSKELAEWYFQDGRAVLAACCHLAVDNIELAMAYLIRGNELELAVCVGTVLGESAAPATHYALELLCKLPTVEECMKLAETACADGNIFETVKYYLLSQEPEKALPVGIDFVKEYISNSNWTLDTVYPILDLLSYIRTEKLVLHTCTAARNELLILCGYIGALLAIRKQYQSIVPALYEYTSQLLKRREVSVPLKIEQLSGELDAWRACTQSTYESLEDSPYTPPSDSQRMIYSTLLKRLKEESLQGIIGPDYVTGSNLPSHSDIHISCLTGLKIQVQPNVRHNLYISIIFMLALTALYVPFLVLSTFVFLFSFP